MSYNNNKPKHPDPKNPEYYYFNNKSRKWEYTSFKLIQDSIDKGFNHYVVDTVHNKERSYVIVCMEKGKVKIQDICEYHWETEYNKIALSHIKKNELKKGEYQVVNGNIKIMKEGDYIVIDDNGIPKIKIIKDYSFEKIYTEYLELRHFAIRNLTSMALSRAAKKALGLEWRDEFEVESEKQEIKEISEKEKKLNTEQKIKNFNYSFDFEGKLLKVFWQYGKCYFGLKVLIGEKNNKKEYTLKEYIKSFDKKEWNPIKQDDKMREAIKLVEQAENIIININNYKIDDNFPKDQDLINNDIKE